jgi:hypothetical protein
MRQSSSKATLACCESPLPAASTTVQCVVANMPPVALVFEVGISVLNVPVHRRLRSLGQFGQSLVADRVITDAFGHFDGLFSEAAFGQQAGRFMGDFIPRRLIRQ